MYEKLTDRAIVVLQLANQEATCLQQRYIGTEHILLGLIVEETGVAAIVLKNLGIDLTMVRQEVEKIIQNGACFVELSQVPATTRAKKVIEYAIEEARNLADHYVGTEHLLLGLVREHEGVAAQVLIRLGIRLQDVRDEVLNLLGRPPNWAELGLLGDLVERPVDLDPKIQELPENAQLIVKGIDHQIALIQHAKEHAVAHMKFDQAAALRDLQGTFKQLKSRLVREWPRS